jgi:23S rRNA (uridine2552-2'-O)-methyltransferase
VPKKGRRRQDHLARRAHSEGYHARSVYKLEALQRKFDLIRPGMSVLDLGAAPGSWTQFAVAQIGAAVVAVDLHEMNVAGARCLQGDFTGESLAAEIAALGPYALVMSDAAPATTGNRLVDTGRSEALVESILAYLPRWLAPGGSLVCKIFQGGGEQRLLQAVRLEFRTGRLHRPEAVRRESFETYLVGLGYRGAGDPDHTTASNEG